MEKNDQHTRHACFGARFDALEVALEFVAAIEPLLTRFSAKIREQLRDASGSMCFNVAEANQRVGGDRNHLFRVALGSASEAIVQLRYGIACGKLRYDECLHAFDLADRFRAMTYRLIR